MLISKLKKALILGMCMAVLSTTAAFAETSAGQQDVVQSQQVSASSSLLDKQKEIDQYVFEKNAKEIADKGFTVTNTGVVDNYVEIGITPYNETNAEFLYKIFGRDNMKVVEGQQAMTLGSNASEAYTVTSAAEEKENSGMPAPTIIAVLCSAILVILGGAVILIRRRKLTTR